MLRSLLFLGLLSAVLALPIQQHSPTLSALPKPSTRPFGLRLAFSDKSSALTLTWSTTASLTQSACAELERLVVARKPSFLNIKAILQQEEQQRTFCGTSTPCIEPSTGLAAHFIHSVSLEDLVPDSKYSYRCGNAADGWSNTTIFKAPPARLQHNNNNEENDQATPPSPTKLLLLGDMGVYRSLTMPALLSDTSSGNYSAIIHVGDLAYDLGHLQGRQAHHFLQLIEPLSSQLPYMVAAGNHEALWNFSHYRSLFRMPGWGASENLYYSFDIGMIHIAVYNTEVFFWPESFQFEHMARMYSWLEKDLKAAYANRKSVPWIVVIGHRPMYCAAGAGNYTDGMKNNFKNFNL